MQYPTLIIMKELTTEGVMEYESHDKGSRVKKVVFEVVAQIPKSLRYQDTLYAVVRTFESHQIDGVSCDTNKSDFHECVVE